MSPSGDALANIAALIDDGGQITIGQLYPIECAAIANDDHNCLAMLQRRPDESLRDCWRRPKTEPLMRGVPI